MGLHARAGWPQGWHHKFGCAPVRQSSLVDVERQNDAAMELARGRNAYISRLKTVPEKVVWSPLAEYYAILFRREIYVYRASNGEVIASVDAKSSRIQDILFLNESIICYSSTFGVLNVWNHVDETMSLKLKAGVKDRIRSILKVDDGNCHFSPYEWIGACLGPL